MSEDHYVPSIPDIWDFLQGFKEAAEAGFSRVQTQLDRIETRLVRIESWNVDHRLDDHEQRILRLEQ